MFIPSHQSEKLSQLQTLLKLETLSESVCAGPLPVADRLKLRRLVDALCHASKVTDEPLPNASRVDAAILELAVSGQQKTAIQADSGVSRVFMVAGAGCEPATVGLCACRKQPHPP